MIIDYLYLVFTNKLGTNLFWGVASYKFLDH